jgi:hypothetical protein
LVAVEKRKERVRLDRPIIIGMTILELSKLHMYNFYYTMVKPTFGDDARLCYTDTDSTVVKVEADYYEHIFAKLREMRDRYDCFDLSEMKEGHPLISDLSREEKMKNAKVLGKFKDEMQGINILEFVAVRAKMYSIRKEMGEEIGKRKGVPKSVPLHHADYIAVLTGGKAKKKTITSISHDPKNLQLITCKQQKLVLSACDDKSYYLNHLSCLRYGHRDIPLLEEEMNEITDQEANEEEKEYDMELDQDINFIAENDAMIPQNQHTCTTMVGEPAIYFDESTEASEDEGC